jgi:hypothetical protein
MNLGAAIQNDMIMSGIRRATPQDTETTRQSNTAVFVQSNDTRSHLIEANMK